MNPHQEDINKIDKDLKPIWDAASSYTYEEAQSNDMAWSALVSKIQEEPKQVLRVSWMQKNYRSVAAAVAILLTAGLGFWYASRPVDTENTIAAEHYKTKSGEVLKLDLGDGTHIVLNSNSELTVAAGFGENSRNITLVGEADFEVAKNPELPFVVSALGSTTTVLGTGFNITAYPQDKKVQIAVSHGKVRFGKASNKLVLVKDQAAVLPAKATAPELISGINAVSWKTGDLVFKQAKLADVVMAIQHRYGKQIPLSSANENRLFTGKFPSGTDVNSIVETLNLALGLQLQVK